VSSELETLTYVGKFHKEFEISHASSVVHNLKQLFSNYGTCTTLVVHYFFLQKL